MEALLVEQKAAIQNFNEYYSDFKKESTGIQTVDYLKAKSLDVKQKLK